MNFIGQAIEFRLTKVYAMKNDQLLWILVLISYGFVFRAGFLSQSYLLPRAFKHFSTCSGNNTIVMRQDYTTTTRRESSVTCEIGKESFVTLLYQIGLPLTTHYSEQLFDVLDQDKNQVVTWNEMQKFDGYIHRWFNQVWDRVVVFRPLEWA